MTEWRTDIENAPKGRRVTVQKIVDGKKRAHVTMERQKVWLASKCGKVILSYWVWPERAGGVGRWCMFGGTEQPVAWREFVEGEFPCLVHSETKKREYPNGPAPAYPEIGAAA